MIDISLINNLDNPGNGWYHIEKTGDHPVDYGRGDEILRISERGIRRMVVNFNEMHFNGPGMMIDGDHLSHDDGQDTRALGWIKELDICEIDGVDELFGYIEWTPRGLQMLKDKEYCQSSTEYFLGEAKDGIYEPEKLEGFALTNRPRILGKRPLCNREISLGGARGSRGVERNGEEETKVMEEENNKEEFHPSDEMTKNERVLFDSLLDKLDVEFDGTEDGIKAILAKVEHLAELEKNEIEAVNADVDEAVNAYEGTLSDSETECFKDEKEELKNSLRESPAALTAFKRALNRQTEKTKKQSEVKIEPRASLNRRASKSTPNPFESKNSMSAFNRRVEELKKNGMGHYDAFQKATSEGLVVG